MASRAAAFDPPREVRISDVVSLYVTEARMSRDGPIANVQVFNGHLIYEARLKTGSDIARRRAAKAVQEREPSVTLLAVEDALIQVHAQLPDLLDPPTSDTGEPTKMSDEEKEALWAAARPLAETPDLLERIDAAFTSVGVVGEQRNRKLLYLAATARLLDRPVSVFMTGPSSAGKSYLLLKTLELLPESAFVNYTSVSPRYLAYSDDDLRHRIVVLFEADGLSDGIGAYIMRSLISENRLAIGTVEKDDAGHQVTRKVAKDGPTALFSSTTEARTVDDELLTRLLRIVVTDDPQHSRAILRGIANAHTGAAHTAVDLAPFHALQEWLAAAGERRVCIPYARALAEQVPVDAVRVRRDFPQLLSLIAACALLHQAQRARAANGAILADVQDYRSVRDLLGDAFGAAQQGGLTAEQREAVTAVAVLHAKPEGESGVSLAAVAAYLKRDPSATSRRLRNPLHLGHVQNLNAGLKGRKAAYVPGDPMPDVLAALPRPEDLEEEGAL